MLFSSGIDKRLSRCVRESNYRKSEMAALRSLHRSTYDSRQTSSDKHNRHRADNRLTNLELCIGVRITRITLQVSRLFKACNTLSGVKGTERRRTPTAWKMALPIAGAGPLVGISETDLAPKGPVGS
jgi:hypothetical protein